MNVLTQIQEFMQEMFGVYTPITYTNDAGATVVPAGFAGVNFEYVFSVLLFALTIYCLFRLLGGFFKWK